MPKQPSNHSEHQDTDRLIELLISKSLFNFFDLIRRTQTQEKEGHPHRRAFRATGGCACELLAGQPYKLLNTKETAHQAAAEQLHGIELSDNKCKPAAIQAE